MSARAPGVGCGAAVVREGRILLVKQLKAPEAGHWSLPGGKVDFLERVEDAVVREIRQEIGVEIAPVRALGVTQIIGIEDQHWVSPIYLARILGGEPANREPDKLAEVAWFPLLAPPEPLALAAREAIAAIGGAGADGSSGML